MSFPAVVDLSTINGSNGFIIDTTGLAYTLNLTVSGAGDVNGDGIEDVIIGAPGIWAFGGASQPGAGECFVVFGTTDGFGSRLELSALDGSNGFRLVGVDPHPTSHFSSEGAGTSVAAAGDVNGDGFADVIIGAPCVDPDGRTDAGETYVIFGGSDGFPSSLELSALDGSNGFRLEGIHGAPDVYTGFPGDRSGRSVAGAGDVNNDGIDDVIVGASSTNVNGIYGAGQSYVIFGHTGEFSSSLELSALDGSNGFFLNGGRPEASGCSVDGAGDVNADGIADLIIGAFYARYDYGASYVVLGRSNGFGSSVELSALDGSDGFRFDGIGVIDDLGASVTAAGDINGDGIDDLIMGAPFAPTGSHRYGGESFVVFGRSDGFTAAPQLSDLDGSNGFVLVGAGFSVAGLGDVNGDGIDDLSVGAGALLKSYVVFGHTGSFSPYLDVSSLDGAGGFLVDQNRVLAGAGDINGDGYADMIASAGYVVFGGPSTSAGNHEPTVAGPLAVETDEDAPAPVIVDLLQGASDPDSDYLFITGFQQTEGGDVPSLTVSGATLSFDPHDFDTLSSDESSILSFSYQISDGVLSVPQTLTITIQGITHHDGTASDDYLTGTRGNDTIEAAAGNDTVLGDTGADRLYGDDGDDFLKGGIGDDRLFGGAGNDTVNGEGGEDRLYGGDGDDRLIGWHSHDTMTGGAGADTFVFHPDTTLSWTGDAPDVITDFSRTEGDRINLVKFDLPGFSALQALFVADGADTVINLSALPDGRDILVEGVTLAELDNAANFVL